MVIGVTIPRLGYTMTEATVTRWLKSEGMKVEEGEPLVVIETEKVSYEVTAPASGVLLRLVAPVDSVVPVGGVVAYIGEAGQEVPEEVSYAREEASKPVPPKPVEGAEEVELPLGASPKAKRLAREKGIDLSRIHGSGPKGLIVEEDVQRCIESAQRTASGLRLREFIPMSARRRLIAERLVASLRDTAQVTLTAEADASEISALHQRLKTDREGHGLHTTITDIFVKLVAKALEKHRIVNSTLEGDEIKVVDEINMGVAVAAEGGLVVPVLRNADTKPLAEVSDTLRALSDKARRGTLSLAEVTGGTFTITNLGIFGVDGFTPILNPPQTATLGLGRVVDKPVAEDGKVVIKPTMILSLTFDHRVIDGHTAAQFLQEIARLMQDRLALERIAEFSVP